MNDGNVLTWSLVVACGAVHWRSQLAVSQRERRQFVLRAHVDLFHHVAFQDMVTLSQILSQPWEPRRGGRSAGSDSTTQAIFSHFSR